MKQTMKKIFVLMASAAVLFAACNKMEEVNTPVDTPVEKETITVELNPVTKTSLDGMATVWTAGDKVSVTANGVTLGNLELVEGSTFSGQLESAALDGATEVTLHYPAGVTAVPATQEAVAGSFANEAALLDGTATMADLRAGGEGASLSNTTALLQFSVALAGDVTFEVGSTKYTVTGCETDKTYYACVAPTTATFMARINGFFSKKASKNVTFIANQIANLEILPEPGYCKYGLVGAHQEWNIAEDKLTKLYRVNENEDLYAVKNIQLKDNGFKFFKIGATSWDINGNYDPGVDTNSYGVHTCSSGVGYYKYDTENGNKWYEYWTNSDIANKKENIGVSNFNTKYDIYLYFEDKTSENNPYQHFKFTIVNAGAGMPE